MPPAGGGHRVVLERLRPEVDCGRFAIKRVVGDEVTVEVDLFTDAHDRIAGILLFRHAEDREWSEVPLRSLSNDRWTASFSVTRLGRYRYTVRGWLDPYAGWRRDLLKRIAARQEIGVELLIGAEILEDAASRATGEARSELTEAARVVRSDAGALARRTEAALAERISTLASLHADRNRGTQYPRELAVIVDRERARFGAWYETFPRSCSGSPDRHGTLDDCRARLPYIKEMGFDVLYLPPIHPIGRSHRKGKNNTLPARAGDPGSPWAIGAAEGGHKAIHPELGTIEDFRRLIEAAGNHDIEIAMDLAFQCSPDHPYVAQHPEWFRLRPDGSIQHAENPPKKYEDIYPFHFDTQHSRELHRELIGIALYWAAEGIRIFRVDNPHTKPFSLWEELIAAVKERYPETIFLAEAFTRPKVMLRLAKLGFTQSYTYFAWRNTRRELVDYFTELTRSESREVLRPNLWPNTPDILTDYLQTGGRPAFAIRLILASTLAASYGIYGPAFELFEGEAREAGSEEYANSEKYEIKRWNIEDPASLKPLIARINRIRRENPALQEDWSLRFHETDNDRLIAYSKQNGDRTNTVLVIVNLDPNHTHGAWLTVSCEDLGLGPDQPYQAHDLLSDTRYLWQGSRNYIELDPKLMPARIFQIRRRLRTERDFDYYL